MISKTGLFFLAAALMSACAPAGPHVVLTISADGAPIPLSGLARLRLEVRACGQGRFPILEDISTDPNAMLEPIEAALVPGTTFYIWLQGWVQCDGACVPNDTATHGTDCECFTTIAPPEQILKEEFCSMWMTAKERTVVPATLGPVTGKCPPAEISDCNNPP